MINLAELKAKQQQVMRKIVSDHALEIQHELGREAAGLAKANGWACDVPAAAKGEPRAQQKVTEKYGGDWMGIKDMSRCTIVIPDAQEIDQVLAKVRAHFSARNGWTCVETKFPKGEEDPCGYSDWKVIVNRRGYLAELQINTQAMIYAKSRTTFLRICPAAEGNMKARYGGVPGGLGHQMFVIYRQSPMSPLGQKAASTSRAYYEYFRNTQPDGTNLSALRAALLALNLNPAHG